MCQAAHAIVHSMMSSNVPRMVHSTFQIERSGVILQSDPAKQRFGIGSNVGSVGRHKLIVVIQI